MKILKIEFKNINSLEGKHVIDFTKEPFIQNNLFAITGPTGSGKSTILDVIPLALFNKIPRIDTAISKSVILKHGAILTRGKKEAYAKVQYACKQGVFSSEWSVREAKNGNLQDYEMFLYDEKGTPITQKKSEVPTKNESLIGLNYEQFIKSVMLAQGEFNKFLKVKKEERSALLEQITGTDIYRRIGIAAFEKYKSFKSSVEDWQKSIKDLESKLILEDEYLELLKEEKQKTEQKIKLNTDLEKIKKQLNQWSKFLDLNNKITQVNQDLTQQNNAIISFEEKEGKQLILHNKTESFADELNEFKTLNQTQEELKPKLDNQKKAVELAQKNKEKIKLTIFNWLKKSAFDEIEILTKLEDFRKDVNFLIEQKNEKLSEYKSKKSEINFILNNLELTYNEQIVSKLIPKLEAINSFLANEEITSLSKEEYLTQKEKLDQKETEIRKAEKLANDILKLNEQIEERKAQKKKYQKQFDIIPIQLKEKESAHKKEKTNLENITLKIENQNLLKTLDDYRNQLINGEECPLCGSTHHPYAKHSPQVDNELEIDKKRVEDLVSKLNNDVVQLKINQESLSNLLKNTDVEILKLNEKLTPYQSEFKTHFKTYSVEDNFTNKIEEVKNKAKKIERIFKEITEREEIKKVFPLIEKLEEVKNKGKEIANKIKEAISEKDINDETNRLVNQWNKSEMELAQNQKLFDELIEQNTTNAGKLNELNVVLVPKIQANGFADIQEALASRLTFSLVQRLRNRRSEMETSVNKLKGELKTYQENSTKLETDLKDSNQTDLQAKEVKLKTDLTEIEDRLKYLFAIKTQQNHYSREIADLKQKIETENKESRVWRMLDSLIGDAKGKKFNDFAQDLTLSHLLHLANKRLEQLKSRYLLSQPTENEDDGLMAIDKDMSAQRRSVRTLSGGESFILSLALALALSDLASKNVKINTLFIDEGFGTLDPETLDKTLDTLERLQQENQKTIGIISHVETLKERISTQIKLLQNGQGLSVLQIVEGV
ncbi:AAA family ATPase [Otariodibacter sp.]|uniref:AAA family ATPase n=1 Tax=Otariodibacter sp. TaxID=3030919 RepID=UPI0026305720|nr:AAA family ATPase [Otariodibacter sp.]